jgi:uncharacterized protein (DUF1778 family)
MPKKRSAKKTASTRKRKEERIQVRMTTEQRQVMDDAAKKAGLDLSAWIRMVAIKAAESAD